jgi:3beta-hydroxy-Delta5-steroid dehydrogenase / steroid Delta-isomerase
MLESSRPASSPTGGAASAPVQKAFERLPAARCDLGSPCLVTGASGFLGRHLVDALRRRGIVVHALDRRAPTERDGVRAFAGDVRDYQLVRRATEGCATVFHTAAVIELLGICRPPLRREVNDINVGGSHNVLRACQAAGVARLVHTSSDTVCYSPGPIVAGDETLPYASEYIDLYAASKAQAERAVLAANGRFGLATVAIRPAGIWGPGAGCYMFSQVVEQLARGRLVATIGDGRSVGDNVHVVNLVHAEMLAAEALVTSPATAAGQVYFVTDEEPMNLMVWFRPLLEALGHRVPRWAVPARPIYLASYLGEWLHALGGPRPFMTRMEVHNISTSFTFSTDKARRELGYRPLIGRDDGLGECVPYCREQLAAARRS